MTQVQQMPTNIDIGHDQLGSIAQKHAEIFSPDVQAGMNNTGIPLQSLGLLSLRSCRSHAVLKLSQKITSSSNQPTLGSATGMILQILLEGQFRIGLLFLAWPVFD